MIQIHSHDLVSRLKHGEHNCHICLCTGMWLNIDIFTAEQLLCSLSCKIFHNIHALTSAIISFSRISLCIFIRQRTSHSCHDCFAHPVLRGDQLDMGVLSLHLCFYRICNLRIRLRNFIEIVHSLFPPLYFTPQKRYAHYSTAPFKNQTTITDCSSADFQTVPAPTSDRSLSC